MFRSVDSVPTAADTCPDRVGVSIPLLSFDLQLSIFPPPN